MRKRPHIWGWCVRERWGTARREKLLLEHRRARPGERAEATGELRMRGQKARGAARVLCKGCMQRSGINALHADSCRANSTAVVYLSTSSTRVKPWRDDEACLYWCAPSAAASSSVGARLAALLRGRRSSSRLVLHLRLLPLALIVHQRRARLLPDIRAAAPSRPAAELILRALQFGCGWARLGWTVTCTLPYQVR